MEQNKVDIFMDIFMEQNKIKIYETARAPAKRDCRVDFYLILSVFKNTGLPASWIVPVFCLR